MLNTAHHPTLIRFRSESGKSLPFFFFLSIVTTFTSSYGMIETLNSCSSPLQ